MPTESGIRGAVPITDPVPDPEPGLGLASDTSLSFYHLIYIFCYWIKINERGQGAELRGVGFFYVGPLKESIFLTAINGPYPQGLGFISVSKREYFRPAGKKPYAVPKKQSKSS